MLKEDLQKLKADLQSRAKELRKQLGEIAHEDPAAKGNLEVTMKDYGRTDDDNAQEEADLDRDYALTNQLERELRDIESAIAKIDNGTYGACSNCNKAIEPKRIKAMPAASLCVACVRKVQ